MPASSRNVPEGSLLVDDRFLRDVAQRYYEMEETQEDIAKKLFCSRQTIGKALQKAKDKGIVRITIVPEERKGFLHNLTRELRIKFRLQDLVLVMGSNFNKKKPESITDGVLADITTGASEYLDQLLTDDTILAVSGGKLFMRSVVRALKPSKVLHNLLVVPTIGFTRPEANFGDSNLIAYDIAAAYGGKHEWLPIPAVVETQEQRLQAQALPIARDVLQTLKKANVVMLGLWPSHGNKKLIEKEMLTQEQIDMLESLKPVVDIDHWAFDANGVCVNYKLDPPPYHLTGLEIPLLKDSIKEKNTKVILVAGASASYIPGILSVLRAGIVNILITDHITAELLMEALG
jgi:deoxyribonucleoside regulator